MASTRELWILLRARDEASRVVSSFSKNVRAAALAAKAAQKSAEAGAIRQQAQLLKTNGATAQQIRAINEQVVALEKQARANTLAATRAREYRAQQMAAIGAEVKSNNLRAANLERQARALTLSAAMADQHRDSIIRNTGASNEQIAVIDRQISSIRKRAATLNAEAAVARSASNSLIANLENETVGLDGSIRSYERRAAAIRAQAAVLRNSAAEQKISLDSQVRALNNQAQALDKQANSLRRAANAAREADIDNRRLITSMGKVSEGATVAAFSLGLIGAGGLIGLKQAINTTAEYDRQVRATATQIDGFGADLKEVGNIGRRVANEIAVPFEQVQPALFDIFSSMEVGMRDAERLLGAFSKGAVAGQVEIQDVSRATIGLLNAFNRPASDVTKILDIQFQLIQEGIGTYEEWNQRIGLVTPSAVRAGQSIEMMTAALATATRMGISAARSGTAVARAMDAMSHPAAVKKMEELGIKARDSTGKLRPMNKVLREFRNTLDKLPEKNRVATILEVFKGAGGTIEARRFLQTVLLAPGALELFDEMLNETSNAAGSMEKAYSIMADGVAGKTQVLSNKWQLLKEGIGTTLLPGFESLINVMSKAFDWFNKLPENTKNTITQFMVWGSVIALVMAGMFAFIAMASVMVAALMTIGVGAAAVVIGIAAIPVALTALGVAFALAYKNSEGFRTVVHKVIEVLKELWGIVTDTATKIRESFNQHLLPPLERLRDTIENKVVPAAMKFADLIKDEFLPRIREAGKIIADIVDGAFNLLGDAINGVVIPAIEKMAEWWDKNGEKLQPLLGILAQVVKWLLIIGAVVAGVIIALFVGPLVAAVAAVVVAFQLLAMIWTAIIAVAKQLWEWAGQLLTKLQEFASSVGSAFVDAALAVQQFFTDVGTWFQELPGKIGAFLTNLPNILKTAFLNAINAAAFAIGFGLGSIVKLFTDFIPRAIAQVAAFRARFIQRMSELHAAARAKAGEIVTGVITWVAQLPGRAAVALAGLASRVGARISEARDTAGRIAGQLLSSVISFMTQVGPKTSSALSKVRPAVLGAFSGAASWLTSAGADMIRGVISGIGSMIGGAVSAARNAATSMVNGFKSALKIKSPSKVFRDIGHNTIRGLINGITGSRKALQNALSRITRDVMNSLKDGKAPKRVQDAWRKRLAGTSKKLMGLEAKRAGVIKKLEAAEKSLNAKRKARADLQKKITDRLASAASIVDLQGSNPEQLKRNLQTRLTSLQEFAQNLATLRSKGLNKETIAELAEAGVEQAGGLVSTLANASASDINEINSLQKQIRAVAGDTGKKVAGQMYDAGIKAAEGLVKGLRSQRDAITKEMKKIADALIKQIKKSLGIRSPSKVFEGIGVNTALGYVQGYRKQLRKSYLTQDMLNYTRVPGFLSTQGEISPMSRTFNQTINVYTNEIDPRRHAAELGQELEGRIR